MKRIAFSLMAVLSFACTSCSDSTLNQIAKLEADLNGACSAAFTVVVGAAQSGLMPQTDANAVVQVLLQVEQADQQAISTLSSANQSNLVSILMPVETAVNNAVANGTLNIKDAATKTKVQTVLVAIQTLLNSGVALIQAAKTS